MVDEIKFSFSQYVERRTQILIQVKMCVSAGSSDTREKYFLETISQFTNNVDLKFVLIANKIDSKTSLDDLIHLALKNLSHKCHIIRTSCTVILKSLTPGLIEKDVELMNRRVEQDAASAKKDGSSSSKATGDGWHMLTKFTNYLQMHAEWSKHYVEEFK